MIEYHEAEEASSYIYKVNYLELIKILKFININEEWEYYYKAKMYSQYIKKIIKKITYIKNIKLIFIYESKMNKIVKFMLIK